MSKKLLAFFLAIVMVLGTVPALALVSFAEPTQLGGYIAAAGYGFEYDAPTQSFKIPYDFDLGDQEDPDLLSVTMSRNAENYAFTVTLTDSQNNVESHAVTDVSEKAYYADTDVGIYFGLSDFTLTNGETYTVRIDIVTPGGNEYYVEEAGLGFNFAPLVDVAATAIGSTTTSWAFDTATGTLTISGTGAMPDFGALTDRPWNDLAYGVQKIVVEEGITKVGKQTGARMTNLDEVVVADGVTELGMDVFAYCGKISVVTLPATLTKIGQGTLYGSTVGIVMSTITREELRAQATVGAYNDSFFDAKWWYDPAWGLGFNWSFDESTGELAVTGTGVMPNFDDFDGEKPWEDVKTQVTSVVIGEGVTSIQSRAFNNMPSINEVILPDTVVQIGGDAFAHCGTISYFRLSANVTSISQGVVYDTAVTTVSCTKDWNAILEQSSVGSYNESFKNATWVDVVVHGPRLSFSKYGTGMENWQGNGDPKLTQILIATPKWEGEYCAALNSVEWTLKIEAADGSISPCLMTMYPRSVYDGGNWSILRFVPALCTDPANRFKPVNGKEYVITATVTYEGYTDTVTSSERFVLNDDPIEFDTYYNITWQIEGTTEYVDNIPAGFKPAYHGEAASYTSGGYAYVVNIPETVAADADATYNITYTQVDMTVGTLGLWGDGYENWAGGTGGTQTELLLRTWDWEGNEHTAIKGHTDEYTWIITIDGHEYNVKPSSTYGSTIWRFEPCLWADQFIPQAGQSYTVSLDIYDGEGALVFTPAAPVTITIADDFETIVPEPPQPQFDKGDIDGNGEVDIDDVAALLDALAGKFTAPAGVDLDVNGDGEVAVSDVSDLLDILAHKA